MIAGGLIGLLIELVIIGLVFYLIWWFVGYVGVPEPFNKVIRVIIGLIALIVLLNLILGLGGVSANGPLFHWRS